jgi:hypothetical protein
LISRGIGLEINGDWHSFKAARWSFVTRRWVLFNGLTELEAAVRNYLETKLLARRGWIPVRAEVTSWDTHNPTERNEPSSDHERGRASTIASSSRVE